LISNHLRAREFDARLDNDTDRARKGVFKAESFEGLPMRLDRVDNGLRPCDSYGL
jgi:hypothetical protein